MNGAGSRGGLEPQKKQATGVKRNKFMWCNIHQQKKILGACPKCPEFPCRQLTETQIHALAEDVQLEQVVTRIQRRRLRMFFFLLSSKDGEEDKALTLYEGKLEDLPPETVATVEEALEVSYSIKQELTWVLAGKEKKIPNIPGAGTEVKCVVATKDGEYSLEEVDPAEPRPGGETIYPVSKHWIRQFVPKKEKLQSKKA